MANEVISTPSKREKLYNNLIGTGKVTEQEIGTKDDFVKSITDNESAKYLYNNLKSKFDEEEIGDESKFVGYLAPDFSGPLPAGQGALPLPTNPAEFKGFENPLVKDIAPGTAPLKSTVAQTEAKPVVEPIENTQQLGDIDSKIESFKKENGDFIQQYEQIKKKIEGDNQAVKYSGREGRVTSFGDFISKAKVSKEERDFYNQNKKRFEELEGSRKAMFIQKDLEQLASNAEKYDPNDSDIKKFVKGLFQTGTLKDFATLGITQISRNLDIEELLHKANATPKLVTPQEKEAISAYEKLRKIESQDTDWTYKTGQMAQQMVPFVVNMIATGGLGASLKTGIGAALNVGVKTGLKKYGVQLAQGMIFNAPRSLVTTTLGTNFAQNRLQGYDIENGEVTKNENAHSVGGDLWRSAVQNYLEYATEQLGELVPTGMAAKLLGNSKVSALFAKTFGGLGKAAGSKGYGAIKKVTDLASVQGIPSEVMEEVVNALGSTALTGSNDMDQLSDPAFYKSIALNTILLGGTFKGAQLATGGVGNRIEKNRVNKQADNSVAALEGMALNVTDESLANQIKLLSENIKAGAFQDEQGNIENGMVSQSLEEVRKAIQASNIENSDEVLGAATKAVIDGAIKTGAYDGFSAIAESEMGGQFAHKKDPGSVIIGTNREGEQFYMLDRFDSGLDKEIHIVRPVNGGETKSVTADEFIDLQILDKKEWLDAWLRTRDALAPIQQAADNQTQSEEQQIQAQSAPITIDEALGTRTFMIGEDRVTVIDATEDGIIAVDDEGNEHVGISLEDLQRIPVEQPIEQPVLEGQPIEQIQETPEVQQISEQPIEAPVVEAPVEKPIPLTKDGSPDYDAMEPEMLFSELSKDFAPEEVSQTISEVVTNLQTERKSVEKKPTKSINEAVTKKRKLAEIDSRINGLQSAIARQKPQEVQQPKQTVELTTKDGLVTAKPKNKTGKITPFQEELRGLGEPTTPQELVAHYIANGFKLKFNDAGGTKGFAKHLGIKPGTTEFNRYFGIRNEKDGLTPERFAEFLAENDQFSMFSNMDTMDILGVVLDVVPYSYSKRKALEYIQGERKRFEGEEYDNSAVLTTPLTEAEYDEIIDNHYSELYVPLSEAETSVLDTKFIEAAQEEDFWNIINNSEDLPDNDTGRNFTTGIDRGTSSTDVPASSAVGDQGQASNEGGIDTGDEGRQSEDAPVLQGTQVVQPQYPTVSESGEQGSIEQPKETPEPTFDFMKDSPMQKARAMAPLLKTTNADGKYLPTHEWIESLEPNLEVGESKIYSGKAKSEDGSTIKKVIGNWIVNTKAEQDYYLYLKGGGKPYSQHLKEKKEYDDVIEAKAKAARAIKDAERNEQSKRAYIIQQTAKNEAIKKILEGQSKEDFIEDQVKGMREHVSLLRNKKQTKDVAEIIAIEERNAESRAKSLAGAHDKMESLYELRDGNVVEKNNYKEGDDVIVDYGPQGRVKTTYKGLRENPDGSLTHIVEKIEGVVNPYVGYDMLLPAEQLKEPWMNKPNVVTGAFPNSVVKTPVFHGSREQFEEFDENLIGKNDEGVFGKGIYLSENKSSASQYAGADYSKVKAFQANIQKPYIVNFNDENSVREAKKLLSGKQIPEEYDGVIVYESGKMHEVVVRNKSQLSRITTDEDIWKAYDAGKYQQAVKEGGLTEKEAREIVESSGIKYNPVQEQPKEQETTTYNTPESFNTNSFEEFSAALDMGRVQLDEFKKAYEVLKNSKEALQSELNGKTKAELLSGMNGMGQYRYKNEKKEAIVRALWNDNLMTFAFGSISYEPFGGTMENAIDKKIANTTQANIDEYVKESQRRRDEYVARVKEYNKGLSNPETLPEFKIFIDRNGLDKLSPEQKAVYDNLITDKVIDKRNEIKENKVIVGKVDLAGVEMDITETKHTKTGADLFVVKLSERVSKEDYQDLNNRAKQLGGYYSSFRGAGAVPGFQFKTREQAQKFVDLKKESASNLDVIEEKQDNRVQNKVSKLRDNAQKIIDRVDTELSKDRLTNTAKRAGQAASTEARLSKEKQIAQTMMNIADAIEDGDVKLLDGISAKTHIELLDNAIATAKRREMQDKYPNYAEQMKHEGEPATVETVEYSKDNFFPRLYAERIKDLVESSLHTSGVKQLAAKWTKKIAGIGERGYYQTTSDSEVSEIVEMIKANPLDKWRNMHIENAIADYNRLKSMGIENDSMLRAALREYVQYRGKSQAADPVKKLERALVGRKNIGIDFFPTPKETAKMMVDEAGITEGMDILEPSAGNGNIADAIKETGVRPDVIELSSALTEILEAKGYDVVANDFMDFSGKEYDRIIMNPPFQNGMDGDHVMHAYDLLKPGGKVVAIVGEGTFIRNDKKATAFREWLDSVGGTEEKLENGTFQDKTLLNTTGANARLVIIEKEDSEVRFRDTPYFYSPTEQALNAIKQEKATPEQWKAMLLKNGAKQAEMDWMQFDDFASNKKSLTRADIQDWINQNRIEIKEVEKGEYSNRNLEAVKVEPFIYNVVDTKTNEILLERVSQSNADDFIDNAHDGTNTKYSQYTTPGGEKYKELLLTMPIKSHSVRENNGKWEVINNKTGKIAAIEGNEESAKEAARFISKAETGQGSFKSGHWDESNILAHIRFNERTGKNGERVLFIEEIQSDWAQKGKKNGFKGFPTYLYDEVVGNGMDAVQAKKDIEKLTEEPLSTNERPTGDEWRRLGEYSKMDLNEIFHDRRDEGVEKMPFKKTDQWVNLSLRRMMTYAAENGFDAIAWTTGEMQADRYDLSKSIDNILGARLSGGYELTARKDREIVFAKSNMSISEVEDTFGKDIAHKIENQESSLIDLSGLDLKVGGSGMIAFYDNIIPNAANKIGKSFGAQTGTIEIPADEVLYGENKELNQNDLSPEARKLTRKLEAAMEGEGGDYSAEEYVSDMAKLGYQVRFDEFDEEIISLTKVSESEGRYVPVQSIPITDKIREQAAIGMPLFSIIGEKGANALDLADKAGARMNALSVARKMESSGKKAKEILLVTGWQRGADKMWRYELPDILNEKLISKRTEGKYESNFSGEEIYSKELINAYPEIKDILVKVAINPVNRNRGSYATGVDRSAEGLFDLSPEIDVRAKDIQNAKEILIHEAQHYIQDKEGFAEGGSPAAVFNSWDEGKQEEYKRLTNEYESLKDAADNYGYYTDVLMAIREVRSQLERLNLQKQYWRLSGEVEARNASNRSKMTEAERRSSLLENTEDVSRKDQIFFQKAKAAEKLLNEATDRARSLSIFGERGVEKLAKIDNGATMLDNLATARLMENNNKAPLEIKQTTGWERGADAKWRFEMPDFELKMPFEEAIKTTEPIAIEDVISDEALFTAYPQLKEFKISFYEGNQIFNQGGSANYQKKIIRIGTLSPLAVPSTARGGAAVFANGNASLKSVLSHEVQHIIQQLEGFERGGNKTTVRDALVKNKVIQLQKNPELAEFTDREKEQIAENEVSRTYDSAYESYIRLGGEVEARNTQHRLKLSDKEKKATLLESTEDVARKYQFIIDEAVYAESDTPSAIHAEALTLAETLNTPVRIISDINEIPASQSRFRQAKGWFDPKTGDIIIVLPNNNSVADIQATILHEVVAHKGLRELLGSKFNSVMEEIFKAMPGYAKADFLAKYGDRVAAAEEYTANMSEKDIEPSTWEKIKAIIRNAFRAIGINLRMNDGDIAFMLWRSKNKLKNNPTAMETAKDIVDSGEMKERMRSMYQMTPQSAEIARLEAIKKAAVSEKNRLIKSGSDRIGLFGDTKVAPNDMFGGEGFDPSAINGLIKEQEDLIKTTDVKISLLKRNEMSGLIEASGQLRFDNAVNFRDGEQPIEKNIIFESYEKADKFIRENGVFEDSRPKDNWKPGELFSSIIDTPIDSGSGYIRSNGDQSKNKADRVTYVERLLTEQKGLTFVGAPLSGAAKIKSSADIAFLFKNLESAASENVFAVLIDKSGNYKVLYISSGGTTSSIVELKLITAAAIEFEASSVCLVHNHPSGSLKASKQDYSAHKDLRETFSSIGRDIVLLDSVIINTDSGKYVTFDDSFYQSHDNEPGVDTYTPGVYQFDRLKLYLPSAERISIADSTDVATYLSKMKRGTAPKLGVITLDRKNQITNYSLYDESISAENLISSIMKDIGKHGETVIIHSNKDLKKSLIDNINRALKPMNSEVLDVIISKQDPGVISSYKSFANGEISLSEPDKPYGNIRFRDSDGDLFNLDTNTIKLTKGEKLIESWQDRMVSGTKLIEEIKKRGGKAGHFSNFVTEETRSSSRAKAEMDDFEDNYFKPMMDKVGEWSKKGIKKEETELYVMAKHAPERNRVIVSREARDKVLSRLDLDLRKTENKRRTATDPKKIAGIDKAAQVLRNEIDFIKNEKNADLINKIIENGYDVVFNQGGRGVIPDNLTTLEYMMAVNAQKKIIGSLESISQSELGNNRSGMSDIDAAEIVQEFEKRVQPGEITEFWKSVNAATQFSLDKSRKYGLISDETYKATKGMYQHYVPLRSWAEKEKVDYQDIFGSNYLGHEILNSVNKQAEGRTSLADNPFGFIASMAESSVVSGNKNEVRRNAWRLIKNNGDMTDLFLIKNSWEINVADPEDAPMWEETFVPPTQEQLDLGIARPLPPNNTYKWHKTKGELEKHQVPVYIDGNRVVMEFKGTIGPRVAAAINGENVVRWAHTDGIAQFTRVMAALKTSKNPDFMLTNFLRDFFFGNMAYYVRGGNPAMLTYNLGRSWVAIHKNFTKGKEDPYLKQMYEDFKMNGGQTGYVYMLGEEKYEKKIERMIKRANEVGRISPAIAAKRTFNILNHGLDYLAHMSEDAMRFSVYLTEVERMMKESSITAPTEAIKKQGALAAKDATTNFNRKGRYGSQTNAFYAFFNASIQGTTNYVKLAKENPARFITANLVLMGIRTAFAAWCLSMIGGDDDDEGYAALSDYIKENNFVIPAGGGKFITIPLPHGARAFTNIGPLALEVLSGRRKAGKATDDYLRSIVSEVSPLNLVGLDKNAFIIPTNFKEGILTIMPTAIRPLAEVAANIDFMGRPIEKKNFLSTDDDKVPRFQNAYASTNKILVGAAKYLNELGGGNAERSAGMHINKSGENWTVEESKVWGAFDVSPAYTEHILESYFGGVGRFVNDLYKTAVSATKGEVPAKQNIPVFRRLYQEPYETKAWQNFYEIRKRVLNTDGSIKAAKDVGNQSEYVGLNNAYNIELAMKFDVYNKIIRNIAKNKLALPEDSPLRKQADEAIGSLVKNLDAEIKEIDKRYNRR